MVFTIDSNILRLSILKEPVKIDKNSVIGCFIDHDKVIKINGFDIEYLSYMFEHIKELIDINHNIAFKKDKINYIDRELEEKGKKLEVLKDKIKEVIKKFDEKNGKGRLSLTDIEDLRGVLSL